MQTEALHSPDEHFEGLFQMQVRRSKAAYLALLEHGQKSFTERGISKQKVAEVAKIYPDQRKLSHTALSRMASMDKVWVSFKKHTSWYNSELVEAVVKIHGAESDLRNLEEFKNELSQLKPYLNGTSDHRKVTTRVLKLEEEFAKFSHKRLKQVCLALCHLLKTTVCPLNLEDGCVELTVSIPVNVAENVFPLSSMMKNAFKKALPTLISIRHGERTVETFEVSIALYSCSLCYSI